MKKYSLFLLLYFYIHAEINGQAVPDPYSPTLDRTPSGHNINERFKISNQYPTNPNINDTYVWDSINFKTDPKNYIDAVLVYFLEGNATHNDFIINPPNAKRQWYHAPAMNLDTETGREFFRGLTRERNSHPKELHNNQKDRRQNWAVGFYNPIGAYTIGEIWKNPTNSFYQKAAFKNGTVSAKLLFTSDPTNTITYLQNTLTWTANLHRTATIERKRSNRIPQKVKLLQLDLAIRDDRSPSKWVFGTYIYYNENKQDTQDWYKHLLLVGVAWNDRADSQYINAEFLEKRKQFNNDITWRLGGYNNTLLNGPVDNHESSCISCHRGASIINKNTGIRYAMDFSLQLDYGIDDYINFNDDAQRNIKRKSFFVQATPKKSSLEDANLNKWTALSLSGMSLFLLLAFFKKSK